MPFAVKDDVPWNGAGPGEVETETSCSPQRQGGRASRDAAGAYDGARSHLRRTGV